MAKNVSLKINGRDYVVPAEWSLIQACHKNGIEVPHYCYHEDLSIAGNCRMCLVKVAGMPKPVIACGTPVTEGMDVDTISEDVQQERRSIMEFLLINHPLDCPECDQAGECRLQNYSYEYGRDHGRFAEEKVVRPKATLGPHVKYWGSRCIVCTRCVRFTDEVSGTGELAVGNRGDHSEIVVFPGRTLDNALSMNTVDICPVGALVSSDFLYRQRVWELKSAESVCADCSVGCNTYVDANRQGEIKRIRPRRNDAVNKAWMCDYGRLSFPYVYGDDRLNLCREVADGQVVEIPWKDAFEKLGDRLFQKNTVYLAGLWNNCETFELLSEEVKHRENVRIAAFGKDVVEDQAFPGFTIHGDKNPNRSGFETILGDVATNLADLANSDIDNLVIISNVPDFTPPPEVTAIIDRAETVTVFDFYESDLAKRASLMVSTLTHFETSGSFMNFQGSRQKFKAAVEPAAFGRSVSEVFAKVRELQLRGVAT